METIEKRDEKRDENQVDWEGRNKRCEELISDINTRATFLAIVNGVANAVKTKDLLLENKIEWPGFANIYRSHPELGALYYEARKRGEEYRQVLREEEADRRAMEGDDKPVYHKGKVCGYVKEYSDHLLALQLKAGNPEKYADRNQMELKGAMLNLVVDGVEREKSV